MDTRDFQMLIRTNKEYNDKFNNDVYFNKIIMALLANKEYKGEITVEDMLDMLCKVVTIMGR